jgi:hypothetical protein
MIDIDAKKQQTVSLSSSEAEYQALIEFTQEAVFTRNLVEELTGQKKPAIIYEDNLGTIFLVKNQQVSSRTKHIDIRHHFMRDLQDSKELDVRFKWSENNSADIMTKNTTKYIYDKHIKQIRHGSLPFWKEDVKQDSSVNEFTHPQMGTQYSPVDSSTNSSHSSSLQCKSRTSKEPLEPSESEAGSQSSSGVSEEPLERQASARVHDWINYKEKLHKSDMQPYAGFVT